MITFADRVFPEAFSALCSKGGFPHRPATTSRQHRASWRRSDDLMYLQDIQGDKKSNFTVQVSCSSKVRSASCSLLLLTIRTLYAVCLELGKVIKANMVLQDDAVAFLRPQTEGRLSEIGMNQQLFLNGATCGMCIIYR